MRTRMFALVCCAASYYRPALRAASTQQALRMPRLAAASAPSRRGLVRMQGGGRVSAAVTQSQSGQHEPQDADAEPPPPKGVIDLNPPRGTRDFYPEDMALQRWLFDAWRRVAAQHGFEEYDAPVLETEALYIRKAGEDVTQQLYSMEDRSGRRLSLRPEMTPSLARMVLGRRNALPMPLKWFSIPQCWRYERMTRGRRREHYQWNLDVWGVEGLQAEAELLSAAVTFCKSVGLTSTDVGIKISTRRVLSELLPTLGVPADKFASTCVLVDKLDKLPADEVRKTLLEQGLDETAAATLLSTLALSSLEELEKVLGPGSQALAELRSLFDLAEAYGLSEWLVLDLSVVRGLAYYTGVVFEGFDRSGELRAIFGGGRYDQLLGTFGGEDLPAAGFGFGDAVIVELLKVKGLLPAPRPNANALLIGCSDEALRPTAMAAAAALRASGACVDLVLEAKKPKWVFKHADRIGVGYVALFDAREADKGLVRVKRLTDAEQEEVPIAELPQWFAKQTGAQR